MKNKKLIITCIISMVVILLISFFVWAVIAVINMTSDDIQLNKIAEKYDTKTTKQLIDMVNGVTGEVSDETESMAVVSVLSKKAEKMSGQDILKEINNKNNSISTKTILVQNMNFSKFNSDEKEQIVGLIGSDIIELSLKKDIINKLDKDSTEYLKKLINEDGELAFASARKLFDLNPDAAIDVAIDIIKNPDNKTTDQLKAAIFTIGNKFENKKSHANIELDKKEFVDFCKDIIIKNNDKDLTDMTIYSLSDTRNIEAVRFLTYNESIDSTVKVGCLYDNYDTFKEMLENNPSVENMELAIDAMLIMPIKEIKPLLEKEKEKINGNEELLTKYTKAIDLIDAEGVNARK